MKKQIKLNLEGLMIKLICLSFLLLIVFSSCKNNLYKEVKVYVDGDKFGWYFVFIEHVNDSSYTKNPMFVYLNEKNFDIIKLYEPINYKLRIYDFKTKKEISDNMKLVSYSGDFKSLISWNFYYPDYNIEPDIIFSSTKQDSEECKIKRIISRKGDAIYDSIIKHNNINW